MSGRIAAVLIASAAAVASAAAAPAGSHAQAPADPVGEVRVEGGTLLLEGRFKVEAEFRTTLGVTPSPAPPAGTGQQFWFFSEKNAELLLRMLKGPGCFTDQSSPLFIFCQPPINRFVIKLGPLDDRFKISADVPKVPGGGKVEAGGGDDAVKGGRNDEKIDTGKGDDNADPGKGRDKVKLGAGDDKADTRDGKRDVINGGKGRDVVAPDGKDKLKNVEVIKRK